MLKTRSFPPPPSIPPGNEDIVGTSGQHGKSLRMSATPKLIIHKWHKSPGKSEKGKSENAKGLKGYRLVCSILASGITQKIFTLPLNSQLFPQFSFDILLMDLAWRIWIPKWLWGGRTHMLHIASSAVIDVQATRKTNKPQELWDRSSWLLGITHLKENIPKRAHT